MKKNLKHTIFIIIIIPFIILAQDKELLSKAIQNELNTKGIKGAKKYFAEQFESNKNAYEVDMNGISELSGKYAKAGKIELSGAVMEIAMPFMQDAMSYQMSQSPNEDVRKLAEIQQAEKKKQKSNSKNLVSQSDNGVVSYQGNPRDDLERFTGLYGDPNETNKSRKLWVMVSCDGYLVAGALWGDASPWWMKAESDKVFTYSDSFSRLKIEFATDASGKAIKMNHDLSHLKSPLERLGPIPNDWEPCLERPKR
jgi:hypothetical protein